MLLLRPLHASGASHRSPDTTPAALVLADTIINIYSETFYAHQLYHFPFLQYLLAAASVMLSIIGHDPLLQETYGRSVAASIRMSRTFCRKTWVSGKTTRVVQRLTDAATKVLDLRIHDLEGHSQTPHRQHSVTCEIPNPGSHQGTGTIVLAEDNCESYAASRAADGKEMNVMYDRTDNLPAGGERDLEMWSHITADFPFELGFDTNVGAGLFDLDGTSSFLFGTNTDWSF